MEVVHHFSAGMKDVYTQSSIDGMVIMRQALGGAGYSNWSSINQYFDDMNASVTFEGDNTVMAQQCFNYL